MSENINDIGKFAKSAKGLSKNPLGIIALFIVLVYGIALLVIAVLITASNTLTNVERLPLIWFIVGFPIIILIVFTLLVIYHHNKLYAPSDYKDIHRDLITLEAYKLRTDYTEKSGTTMQKTSEELENIEVVLKSYKK